MFVDFDEDLLPPFRPEPLRRPAHPQLSERQQSWLMRIVLANVLLLFLAPIAGGTIIAGVVALLQ